LYLIQLSRIASLDEHWWQRRGRSTAWDWVWDSNGQLHNWEDRMKPSKLRRYGEMIGSVFNTSFNGKRTYLTMR
jgi:hypothetical protein